MGTGLCVKNGHAKTYYEMQPVGGRSSYVHLFSLKTPVYTKVLDPDLIDHGYGFRYVTQAYFDNLKQHIEGGNRRGLIKITSKTPHQIHFSSDFSLADDGQLQLTETD